MTEYWIITVEIEEQYVIAISGAGEKWLDSPTFTKETIWYEGTIQQFLLNEYKSGRKVNVLFAHPINAIEYKEYKEYEKGKQI